MELGEWTGIDGHKKELEEILESNCGKGLGWFVKVSVVAGFVLSLAAIAVLYWQGANNLYITIGCVAGFVAPLILHFFLQHYLFELRKKRIEKVVPDLLLQASAFPKGTGFLKVIEYFSHSRFGALGKEFGLAKTAISKGASIPSALDRIAARCKSAVVSRAMMLLKQGYASGADTSSVLREAASDQLETNAILMERNAALVVEKYTLLLAGGIIVPAVIGLLAGMVYSTDFSALELVEFGLGQGERARLLETALFANQVYIAEYAVLASLFLASIEGNAKKAVLYAMLLLPASFFSFHAARAFLL